jgi:Zn-dependent peptidase ImmA (M78 family)
MIGNLSFGIKTNRESEYNINVKNVLIFKSVKGIQESLITVAKKSGTILIEISQKGDSYKRFNRLKRIKYDNYIVIPNENWKSDLKKVLLSYINESQNKFEKLKIDGVEKLTKSQIKEIATNESKIVKRFGNDIFSTDQIKQCLKIEYNIEVKYQKIDDIKNQQRLAYYNKEKNEIIINESIKGEKQETFTLAHEFGHLVLHKEACINEYNSLEYINSMGSVYNSLRKKWDIVDDKGFMEYQANTFAAEFLLNKKIFIRELVKIQKEIGVRILGYVFKDNQPCNKFDYQFTIAKLSEIFQVTGAVIEIRLENLGLIRYPN